MSARACRNGRTTQGGYVALLTVLVASAVTLAMALALLTGGTNSSRSTQVAQQSAQARNLAHACAEEGLQLIHDNLGFSGSGSLNLGQGSCTYTVSLELPTTRIILATGTVGTVVRKVQVYATINVSSISVTSWQEVAD